MFLASVLALLKVHFKGKYIRSRKALGIWDLQRLVFMASRLPEKKKKSHKQTNTPQTVPGIQQQFSAWSSFPTPSQIFPFLEKDVGNC